MDIIHYCEELLEAVEGDETPSPSSSLGQVSKGESNGLVNDISSRFANGKTETAPSKSKEPLADRYREVVSKVRGRIEQELGHCEEPDNVAVKRRIYNECGSRIGACISRDMSTAIRDGMIWSPCIELADRLEDVLKYLIADYKIDKAQIEEYESAKNKQYNNWITGYKKTYPSFWIEDGAE